MRRCCGAIRTLRRVGKATASAPASASEGESVPTITSGVLKVATAQVRLCPPYSLTSFRGDAKHRARNPFYSLLCGPMDSGFALRAPRNDGNRPQLAACAACRADAS